MWNRTAILEILKHELERGRREGHSTGPVLADIDFFKTLNDTHGHQAGDAVLCEVARRFSLHIRSYDSLGRYGGEEFMLVMPNFATECHPSRVEELRTAITFKPVLTRKTELSVTCSFGVVCSGPGHTATDGLIRLADEALYQAKTLGRNRVEVHQSATAS